MLSIFLFLLGGSVSDLHVANVEKISQIIGETDRQRGRPAENQTETRAGIRGTDLGASFEYKGRLVFLFGDTWPVGPNTEDRPVDGDAIAFCEDRNPEDGLPLEFIKAEDGKYEAVHIPGVSLGGFEVPTGGFSANGHMYAVYTTDHSRGPRGEIMGRSVLARSDDGKRWEQVFELSRNHFINVSPVVVNMSDVPGLPKTGGKAVLFFASGREYRRSSPRLACLPLFDVERPSAIRYWSGSGWSRSESDAQPLFVHEEIGEVSVAWSPQLHQWLMTYNSGHPRGIVLRTSPSPIGPWSDPLILFDPHKDGYGKFMHIGSGKDGMSDPGRERDWGGEYGPYMIPSYFRAIHRGVRIYFTMSTWNPYAVVLMKADVTRK